MKSNIWKERNNRTFNLRGATTSQLLQRIGEDIAELCNSGFKVLEPPLPLVAI